MIESNNMKLSFTNNNNNNNNNNNLGNVKYVHVGYAKISNQMSDTLTN